MYHPQPRSGATPDGITVNLRFRAIKGTYTWAIYFGPSNLLLAEGPYNTVPFAETIFDGLQNGRMKLPRQGKARDHA